MADDAGSPEAQFAKDGRTWRIGSQSEVEWIDRQINVSRTITAGIPPVFDAYATIEVPVEEHDRQVRDAAVLTHLTEQSPDEPWWLGYLDDGVEDVVFPLAPRVTINPGWKYVLVEAGQKEAATWRANPFAPRGAMPEVIFPADQSWLLNTLWDDDWSCLGGTRSLIERLLAEHVLKTREVTLGEDAVPPGHIAI